jgi:hypothetical protein
VQALIRTNAVAVTGGGADAVVIGDGEGLLQLQEVGGVPCCSSVGAGARQASVTAASRGRRWW